MANWMEYLAYDMDKRAVTVMAYATTGVDSDENILLGVNFVNISIREYGTVLSKPCAGIALAIYDDLNGPDTRADSLEQLRNSYKYNGITPDVLAVRGSRKKDAAATLKNKLTSGNSIVFTYNVPFFKRFMAQWLPDVDDYEVHEISPLIRFWHDGLKFDAKPKDLKEMQDKIIRKLGYIPSLKEMFRMLRVQPCPAGYIPASYNVSVLATVLNKLLVSELPISEDKARQDEQPVSSDDSAEGD